MIFQIQDYNQYSFPYFMSKCYTTKKINSKRKKYRSTCKHEGCIKFSKKGGFCVAHGGGHNCKIVDCKIKARDAKYGFCYKHLSEYKRMNPQILNSEKLSIGLEYEDILFNNYNLSNIDDNTNNKISKNKKLSFNYIDSSISDYNDINVDLNEYKPDQLTLEILGTLLLDSDDDEDDIDINKNIYYHSGDKYKKVNDICEPICI